MTALRPVDHLFLLPLAEATTVIPRLGMHPILRRARLVCISLLFGACTRAAATAAWPVYQGSDAHDHYVTLSQIAPANVSQLEVAWTYDTKDAFPGSEMQSNPVIQAGVLYAMSPKQRAFALDAATGRELWSFDQIGRASSRERGTI